MTRVYYNEFDRTAAEWLRQLIRDGLIPGGWVDDRSIEEVRPEDIEGYDQCHFFAGIGGWAYALSLAGWTGTVWTGSCPCQPFSAAGKRLGNRDARNLWPEFRRLVAECRPSVVFGEQVASEDGRDWLAGVRRDVEAVGYRFGAADLCAAGVGAPHIRQRLYWVADGHSTRRPGGGFSCKNGSTKSERPHAVHSLRSGRNGRLGDADPSGREGRGLHGRGRADQLSAGPASGAAAGGGMDDTEISGASDDHQKGIPHTLRSSHWDDCYLIPCTDGKARRSGSGVFPLAHGVPGRVGLIRGYGNAIVPALAAEFVRAYQEAIA
jgi:DNA (cytosine-5)-methyltransferase 1